MSSQKNDKTVLGLTPPEEISPAQNQDDLLEDQQSSKGKRLRKTRSKKSEGVGKKKKRKAVKNVGNKPTGKKTKKVNKGDSEGKNGDAESNVASGNSEKGEQAPVKNVDLGNNPKGKNSPVINKVEMLVDAPEGEFSSQFSQTFTSEAGKIKLLEPGPF